MPDLGGIGRLRARTRLLVIAAMALVLAAVAALILGEEVSGSRAGAAAKTRGSGSATVARRDLIETDTESGTLSHADPRTVFNRLSGTITSLPAAGTVVQPGGVLFTVDNSPVVLMDGALPAYRSLANGVADGPDVRELEQNLAALGFDPTHAMAVDDHFDAATTAAVERWQGATSQTQTGTVTLGQVVFLPGARRVSAVSAALGSTGGSSGGSATGAALRRPAGGGRAEFVDLTTSTTPSTTTTSTTTTAGSTTSGRGGAPPAQGGASTPTLMALIALLRAEVAELKAAQRSAGAGSATSRNATSGGSASGAAGTPGASGGGPRSASGAGTAAGGSGAASNAKSAASSSTTGTPAAQAVLSTTSTQLVATVPLDATKQSEAVLGAPVTVQMPDGSTIAGRISQVAAAAQSSSSTSTSSGSGSGSAGAGAGAGGSSGSGASSTVPVTITLRGRVRSAGLDQAAVSVNFEQQKALGVLSVPVTALLATAGGGYAIQPVDQPRQLIPVTPGLFAAGYVQISGSGIVPGLTVTDSQG